MMEWIKCSDRLPPLQEKEYLVCAGDDVDIYWWKHFRTTGRIKEWDWNDRDGFLDFEVTHWMPLPNPPEE